MVCAALGCAAAAGWVSRGGAGRTAREEEAAAADLDDVVVVELPPLVLLERLAVQDGAAGVSLAHVNEPDLRARDGGVAGNSSAGAQGRVCVVCVQLCHLVLVVGHDLGLTLGDLRQTDLNVAAFRVPVAMRHTRLSAGRGALAAVGEWCRVGSAEEERACR